MEYIDFSSSNIIDMLNKEIGIKGECFCLENKCDRSVDVNLCVLIPCGHITHHTCFLNLKNQSFMEDRHVKCPICRKETTFIMHASVVRKNKRRKLCVVKTSTIEPCYTYSIDGGYSYFAILNRSKNDSKVLVSLCSYLFSQYPEVMQKFLFEYDDIVRFIYHGTRQELESGKYDKNRFELLKYIVSNLHIFQNTDMLIEDYHNSHSNTQKRTIMHVLIDEHRILLVKKLINNKYFIEKPMLDYTTPIMQACKLNYLEMVELLLPPSIDIIGNVDEKGNNAIMYLIQYTYKQKIADIFTVLSKSNDIALLAFHRNNKNMNGLMLYNFIPDHFYNKTLDDNIKLWQMFISLGISVKEHLLLENMNILHYINVLNINVESKYKYEQITEEKININVTDETGNTPFINTIIRLCKNRTVSRWNGISVTTLPMLISQLGLDVDHQNMYGLTALHYCIYYSDWELTSLLLDNGSDLCIENINGITPLHVTIWYSSLRFKSIMFEYIKTNSKLKWDMIRCFTSPQNISSMYDDLSLIPISHEQGEQ